MGQARQKANRPALTDAQRQASLGPEPFAPTYDLIFGMAESVFTKVGSFTHQVIGLDFQDGKPTGVNVLQIRNIEDVPRLVDDMLQKWPMVVHVFEGWAAPPDSNVMPSEHPKRYEIINMMMHTSDQAAAAMCRIDGKRRTIERGTLLFPDHIGGRIGGRIGGGLGHPLPTRH